MRNVIVTVAANYGLDKIEAFLCSWRENAPDAALVVFTSNCEAGLHQACARMGATTIELTEPWRYSLLVGRHFVFRNFLRANRERFDNVLIADCRDLIFQSDPFAVPRDAEVWFAAEDERIGKCDFNRYWMAMVYGGETADELAEETIACAGTTIGTCNGVLRYLDLICHEADARPDRVTLFADQASHNYIFYKLKPDFIGLDRHDRVVHTLNHTSHDRIAVRGDEVWVDGAVSPVVHQWDRHPDLVGFIGRRYRLPAAPGTWRTRLAGIWRSVQRPAAA